MAVEENRVVNAAALNILQSCPRRFVLEREYTALRKRPREVLERLLRAGIFHVSNGLDPQAVAAEQSAQLLEFAAKPGFDTLHHPYTLAKDLEAVIYTVLEAVSRLTLLTLKPGPCIDGWQVSAFQDESGLLHRWCVHERWDEDTQYRELHSHDVFGDCAAAQVGMTLHVIEIGSARRGHQHTPWCRAYKHPAIAGHYKFQKTDGTRLERSWIPVWYQDSDKNDPKTWVDLMESDRLELIKHLDIRDPHPSHVEQFRREVAIEAKRMDALGKWEDVPMHRPACDMPYACPWQNVCYAPVGPVNIEALGGYKKKVSNSGQFSVDNCVSRDLRYSK